jgi:SAM-dependent methyltransferase
MGKVSVSGDIKYSTHSITLERAPEIWKCRACKSWFTQNAIPEATSHLLYVSGDSGNRWTAEPFEKAKNAELIREFDRNVGAGCRLLDIGCSTGLLLDYAKKRGAATSGMDYSEASGALVRQKEHRFALSLSEFFDEQFDVITAFDVVEHLYDMASFLRSVARMLRPGGKLLILTGDLRCLGARLCRNQWWYLQYPEHIVFPSHKFFETKLKGLRLERTVRTYASVGYRVPLLSALRASLSLGFRGRYDGLPSLGPDHMLLTLSHD